MKKLIFLMAIAITCCTTTISCSFKIPLNGTIKSYLEESEKKELNIEKILPIYLNEAEESFLSFRKSLEKKANNRGKIDLRDLTLLEAFKTDSLLVGENYVFTIRLKDYNSLEIENKNPEDSYKFKATEGEYEKSEKITYNFLENPASGQKLLTIFIENEKENILINIETSTGLILNFYKTKTTLEKAGIIKSKNYRHINFKGQEKTGEEYIPKEGEKIASETLNLFFKAVSPEKKIEI